MVLRDYKDSDRAALEQMKQEQGHNYTLPSLSDSKLWISRKVLADDNDIPIQALLGRLTSEAYFLFHPTENGMMVMRRFLSLHEACCDAGRAAGLDSVHCWLPPDVDLKFGSQLQRLGWINYIWPTYCKSL
jgi:hypothetical protein